MTRNGKKIRPWRISHVTGEFLDPDMESRYLENELHNVAAHVRTITNILGLLFFSFIIPDWFILGPGLHFSIVLSIRFLSLVFMIYVGFRLAKSPTVTGFIRLVTAAELIFTVLFVLTFALYQRSDFLIQAFGLMLMLSAFYLVPNRFLNHIALSLLAIAVFLNVAHFTIEDVSTMHMLAGTIYLILITGASAATFSRTSYHKRRLFVNNQRLRQLAVTDSLTHTYNRHKFNEELWRETNRYRRTGAPLSIVIMDLDDFKAINDRFGHLQGDRVLVQVARAIHKEIRVTDIFARWGGEEFVLLLPATATPQAGELTLRLLRLINSLHLESTVLPDFHPEGDPEVTLPAEEKRVERIPVRCSFGIAEMQDADTPETLIQRADRLLYQAKSDGRNCIVTEAETLRCPAS
jgi:diguanylate cyclase (GGDEF)-like protein